MLLMHKLLVVKIINLLLLLISVSLLIIIMKFLKM